MLHEFLVDHREPILTCSDRKTQASEMAPRMEPDTDRGVGRFFDQLVGVLKTGPLRDGAPDPGMHRSASDHGAALFDLGCSVERVVREYGNLCQAITEMAVELRTAITTEEFHTLNRCLDDAIAAAVGEHGRRKDRAAAERRAVSLAVLVHDIRNLVGTATLAQDLGDFGTEEDRVQAALVLRRSLERLKATIESSVNRLPPAAPAVVTSISAVLEEISVSARFQARSRGVDLVTESVAGGIEVYADRQRLLSALTNLVDNAVKFSRTGGTVRLRTRATADRVLVDVEDECGGLAPGKAADLFRNFEQRNTDRSGLGVGLAISLDAISASGGEIGILDRPGEGCTFTLDLPRRLRPDGTVAVEPPPAC